MWLESRAGAQEHASVPVRICQKRSNNTAAISLTSCGHAPLAPTHIDDRSVGLRSCSCCCGCCVVGCSSKNKKIGAVLAVGNILRSKDVSCCTIASNRTSLLYNNMQANRSIYEPQTRQIQGTDVLSAMALLG